ncbi:uncharacterized protein LOC135161593 [Diachasmimorpha longicaudata]|uniref:uncharacterized protein LOC135161593 n=1 Tax=Diachasmimorpha longicaudata TaxID=58733 RepID=UPI0030B8AC2A
MRPFGLIAAFAAILITHGGAAELNSADSMIEFISNTIANIEDYKTDSTNNASEITSSDYIAKRTRAFEVTSSSLINPVFNDALKAAREAGKNVDECLKHSNKEFVELRDRHITELRFCGIEHASNYRRIESKINSWKLRGEELQEQIKNNFQCNDKDCKECEMNDCSLLKEDVEFWKVAGENLKKHVDRSTDAMKRRTFRCFDISEHQFQKGHDTQNTITKYCLTQLDSEVEESSTIPYSTIP